MAQKQLNLTVALKDGVVTSVDDVESGLKCGCVCPACGEKLIAKKGAKRMHHFAHFSGHTCEYGYESSLHLAAKEILSKARKITIPSVYVVFPESGKRNELVCNAKEIEIEKVELEKRLGDIIPDVVVYAGGKQLFVEIYVTHRIDNEKLQKLEKVDVSTIEIDLSAKDSVVSMDELTDLLLSDNDKKTWKYNAYANKWLHRFYQIADRRETIARGYAVHVDNCPIKMRVWNGKPYANFIDDCIYCKYCIYVAKNGALLCSGRQRIATVADFKIPAEERMKESEGSVDEMVL